MNEYVVHLEGDNWATVVPVFADSLEEALDVAELKYTEAGAVVTRVQPKVHHTSS